MPPVSPPPDAAPDEPPSFAMPYPHRLHHAAAPTLCGCGRRMIRAGEVYVTIGGYERVNCWGCRVYYGWARLDEVPDAIRAEVAATQDR